jgi:hypothetical protein
MASFPQIFIPPLILFLLFVYYRKQNTDVTVVRSKSDGKEYVVQNKPDKQQAAELLAALKVKLSRLVDDLKKKYPDNDAVNRLVEKFHPDRISEGGKDKSYTTYTLNKGEKIVFCLRTRDEEDRLHDLNLMAFVAIHELSHIMTLSTGHTEEFQKNFAFLLKEAVEFGLYQPQNFRSNPTNYCGIAVTDTPLTDDVLAKTVRR